MQSLCTLDGSERDADDLLAAYRDSETQGVQQRYLASRKAVAQ
jgi:hypothetical protein